MMRYWLLLIVLASTSVHARDVSIPDFFNTQWVGKDIVHNGLPLSIRQFTSTQPTDAILQFYQQEWPNIEGQKPTHKVIRANGWLIISHLKNGKNTVIQAKPNARGGATGLISVAVVKNAKALKPNSIMKLPDTQVISQTESTDLGKKSVTTLLKSYASTQSNADFYQHGLRANGWTLVRRNRESNFEQLAFSNGQKYMDITVSPNRDNSTTVMINRVDKHND